MLLPIRTVIRARSYFSTTRNTNLADFLPSSASTCILKRFAHASAVSPAEKKKCANTQIPMITHDRGTSINEPHPSFAGRRYKIYHTFKRL